MRRLTDPREVRRLHASSAGTVGLAGSVVHGDTEFDFETSQKALTIVGPMVEGPAVGRSAVAAALAARVEINELDDIGKWGEIRLEAGMVEARGAVEEDGGRDFAHSRAFGVEFCALDIEEEFGVANLYTHDLNPGLLR